MRRRELITVLGGAAAWPFAARAQRAAVPVVALFNSASVDSATALNLLAFRNGLEELGFVEGRNVAIEYHFLGGQYDGLSALMTDIIRRRIAVIATPGDAPSAFAAKAATSTIPIVFGVGDDPVRTGLVASLARPGGNVTGMNFFSNEVLPKKFELLHQLLPRAARMAVLINPRNPLVITPQLQKIEEAARSLGSSIEVLNATTGHEIEDAFAQMVAERIEALIVAPDGYFASRRVQFAIQAARHGIALASTNRYYAEVGALMSYGTSLTEMFHQVGAYVGQILKGAKPTDLPVVQPTRFEFIVNMQTARAFGIEVPPTLLALADEIIE